MERARNHQGDRGPELLAELLARGREVTLRARGSSMAPLVRDGDLLALAPLVHAPRIGELLAAISSGRLLVHRVVGLRAGEVKLRGDALWEGDGWFRLDAKNSEQAGANEPEAARELEQTAARIIGRAVSLHRGDRTLGRWRFAGPGARAFVSLLPLLRLFRGVARRLSAIIRFDSEGRRRSAS